MTFSPRELREQEEFVDVTLACEGQQVAAHKVVLSACSPYFRSLLKVSLLNSRLFLVWILPSVRHCSIS